MPPRSPLAARHGLSAAWVRTPDRDRLRPPRWQTVSAWLREKIPDEVDVDGMLADARFVYDDGSAVRPDDEYRPHTFVWFHRDLREEVEVPGELSVLHRDERLVVVDKPPFLSTIPRGRHVRQSVVVRLRDELGLPELSPLHRLDRVTSGVLMLATERRWRGPYQTMFEQQRVRKTYLALAPWRDDLALPVTVRNHIHKTRGVWQAQVVPDAPVNAVTDVEVEARAGDLAVYRLTPHTGRTHQLRLHLHDLGIPIVGDPLYPEVLDVSVDDFSRPLQLLASTVELVDPVDGGERRFVSARQLPLE
ncbi:pseudouridine synthase [Janibacter sp. DB-40]|uniref:pseudouridine synthase n=1 Tax=Janibacter sp. DB-40 TaxID=3028808 RepID=UPI002405EFA0|nr:pseudouridine synthase [Janibacter sp. DB-40]